MKFWRFPHYPLWRIWIDDHPTSEVIRSTIRIDGRFIEEGLDNILFKSELDRLGEIKFVICCGHPHYSECLELRKEGEVT